MAAAGYEYAKGHGGKLNGLRLRGLKLAPPAKVLGFNDPAQVEGYAGKGFTNNFGRV
jgi:hypothetical protein